ncbi:MAG: FlgD immunoglobulin-like domain containing protein [candidate division WOR-3 bacterium]
MRKHSLPNVLFLLALAVSAAQAGYAITGWLRTRDYTVQIDSVTWYVPLVPYPICHPTPDWKGPPNSQDSCMFPVIQGRPSRAIIRYGVDSIPNLRLEIMPYLEDTWYTLPVSLGQRDDALPLVQFKGTVTALEELSAGMAARHEPLVKPSIVQNRVWIDFTQTRDEELKVLLYDPAGRVVRTICQERLRPGRHMFTWDCHDDAGHRVRPGVYFVRLETGTRTARAKIIVQD